MKLSLILAAPLALIALPAVAADRAHGPADVSAAIAKGCIVQQVHTPAGKIVGNSAIVTCPARADVAAEDKKADKAKL